MRDTALILARPLAILAKFLWYRRHPRLLRSPSSRWCCWQNDFASAGNSLSHHLSTCSAQHGNSRQSPGAPKHSDAGVANDIEIAHHRVAVGE